MSQRTHLPPIDAAASISAWESRAGYKAPKAEPRAYVQSDAPSKVPTPVVAKPKAKAKVVRRK